MMYIDVTTAESEPLPLDHEYSWNHSARRAGLRRRKRRVGYELEVGRSVRTAGGAVTYCAATRTAC